MTTALLVYYSKLSRDYLERMLRSQGIEVYLIPGRAPDATENARMHPADVVVIDKNATDISVTQAARQMAQILPESLIFTAAANRPRAEVYRKGRRVGTVNLEEILHFAASAPPEVRTKPRENSPKRVKEEVMNKIESIIRPEKLNCVKDALADAGLVGLNVTPVTGRGNQKGIAGAGARGGTVVVDMLPKVKLELVVSDGDTQKALDTIIGEARTGNIGDGKIFITPVANAIRVRTGEEGDQAL